MLKLLRNLTLLLLAVVVTSTSQAATLEVGPGKTYTKIQDAITASRNRDTILVYDGIYAESVDFNGKSVHLKSVNGPTNTTISGAGHAIYMHNNETADAKVEGFTLRASSSYVVRIDTANPIFTNVVVTQGTSSYGLYFANAKSTLTNLTVTANNTTYPFYATTNSVLSISGASFTNNKATHGAGIAIVGGASVDISNSTFQGNTASNYGGAIYASGAGLVSVSNSKFFTNKGTHGGAIYLESNTIDLVRVSGCQISNNTATYGAGIYNYNSVLHANDNAFSDNLANGGQGGGLYLHNYSRTALINNTFVFNDANQGGAIYQYTVSDLLLLQNIMSQSTSGTSYYSAGATGRSIAWYNIWYDNYPSNFSGTAANVLGKRGNIEADPMLTGFVDDRNPVNDSFVPDEDSPAIDGGSMVWLDTDGSTADIGVGGGDDTGRPVTGDLVVAPQGGTGVYTSITKALAAASSGQKIVVYPSIYGGNYDPGGKNVAIVSAYGPETTLMAGTGATLQYDNAEDNRSIVDGFTIWTQGSSYAVYVVTASPTLSNNHFRYVDGSYVTYTSGGNTTYSGSVFEDNNVSYVQYLTGGTHILRANSYVGNKVTYGGGVATVGSANVTITDSLFDSNSSASYYGGAIYSSAGGPLTVDTCRFYRNKAVYGGAFYLDGVTGLVRISNSSFAANNGTYGGGIYVNSTSLYLNDNSLADNTATQGGAIYTAGSSYNAIFNNTFASNDAGTGGSIFAYNGSNTHLLQNIFYKTTGGSAVYQNNPNARVLAWYNLFYQNSPGDWGSPSSAVSPTQVGVRSNTNADPKLTGFSDDGNYANDSFVVASSSPAVNGGSPEFKDADGSTADIGVGGSDDTARPVTGTRTVASSGTGAFSTVTSAVSASSQGDKIVVYPGVWAGNINTSGKNIQIVSAYGPQETTLVGTGATVTYSTSEDSRSVLDGFTAWTTGGSYILYTSAASPVIQNMHFRYMISGSYATYNSGGTIPYTNCIWENNANTYTSYATGSTVSYTSCTFKGNNVTHGGGIGLAGTSKATISNASFEDNKASNYGGAIYLAGAVSLTVDNSTFTNNSATHGGAVYMESASSLSRISNSYFGLNKATYGGGIYNYGSSLYSNDNRIIENNATAGQGGAYYLHTGSDNVIMNNTILGNAASQGGGLYVYNSADT